MGQAVIAVRSGAKIPLQVTLGLGETDKIVMCTLFNQSTGDMIEENIELEHVSLGYYANNEIEMPVVHNVVAVYEIFEDDGTTPSTTSDSRGMDVFVLANDCIAPVLEIELENC